MGFFKNFVKPLLKKLPVVGDFVDSAPYFTKALHFIGDIPEKVKDIPVIGDLANKYLPLDKFLNPVKKVANILDDIIGEDEETETAHKIEEARKQATKDAIKKIDEKYSGLFPQLGSISSGAKEIYQGVQSIFPQISKVPAVSKIGTAISKGQEIMKRVGQVAEHLPGVRSAFEETPTKLLGAFGITPMEIGPKSFLESMSMRNRKKRTREEAGLPKEEPTPGGMKRAKIEAEKATSIVG